jgi:hypothetical protein
MTVLFLLKLAGSLFLVGLAGLFALVPVGLGVFLWFAVKEHLDYIRKD